MIGVNSSCHIYLLFLLAIRTFSQGFNTNGRQFSPSRTWLKMSTNALSLTPLQSEALSKFFKNEIKEIKPTSGGVSNYMSYITDANDEKYVLRIYNNGKNSGRVKFEHELMNKIPTNLPFATPKALPSLESGATHELLSSGDECCVFRVIPGALPKLSCVKAIGVAAGVLNTALASISTDNPSQSPPYYDLYAVHHAMDREKFYEHIKSNSFDDNREGVNKLVGYITRLENQLADYLKKGLPEQLIHADLHYDNVLVLDGKVTGLLDFEYAARDWRAMELAICLSKYAGEPDAFQYFEEFTEGFAEHGVLTAQEIEMIPDLIVLRILSNVVFFVGRTITGEDSPSSLTSRADAYSARIEWILGNKDKIVNMVKEKML